MMKVTILDTGYLECDANLVVANATLGTYSCPHVQNKWIRLPVMAILIEHDKGKILYDLGSHPDAMKGYWPLNLRELYPLYQTEEQRLENQLALCGVKPEDIDTVVISHLHLDHAGGMRFFTHADVYAPKADYIQAQTLVHANPDPATHGGYVKAEQDIPVRYHLVEEDFTLIDGVDIINLPGHTPGLLGVVVHTENSGTLIFPQDCVYTSEIYGPPAKLSGFMYDSKAFAASVEKVRALQKKYDAKVFYAHDDEFFQTVKKAPEFYD